MKRKVIKQGAGTLTMSLPNSWVKMFKIKAGDEINVMQEGKILLISTKEVFKSKKSELDFSGFNPSMIWIYLNNIYVRGDDEVRLHFDNPKIMNEISRATNNFIGFDIIEQGKNYCVLKDLSGTTDTSLDMILRRVFLLILSIAEEGVDMLKKKNIKTINEVLADRDHDVNKLVNFYLRTLNKKGLADFQETMHYYGVINLLEHLGDEYSRMYTELEKPVNPESIKLFEDTVKLTREFYNLFYKYNLDLANKIRDNRNKIRVKANKLMQKKSVNEIRFLYRLKKIAELIFDIEKVHISSQI